MMTSEYWFASDANHVPDLRFEEDFVLLLQALQNTESSIRFPKRAITITTTQHAKAVFFTVKSRDS